MQNTFGAHQRDTLVPWPYWCPLASNACVPAGKGCTIFVPAPPLALAHLDKGVICGSCMLAIGAYGNSEELGPSLVLRVFQHAEVWAQTST